MPMLTAGDTNWTGCGMTRIWGPTIRDPLGEVNSMSEPCSLRFADTYILIYAHDVSAEEKHRRAQQLLRDLWRSGGE